jgi:hypothetical protein
LSVYFISFLQKTVIIGCDNLCALKNTTTK